MPLRYEDGEFMGDGNNNNISHYKPNSTPTTAETSPKKFGKHNNNITEVGSNNLSKSKKIIEFPHTVVVVENGGTEKQLKVKKQKLRNSISGEDDERKKRNKAEKESKHKHEEFKRIGDENDNNNNNINNKKEKKKEKDQDKKKKKDDENNEEKDNNHNITTPNVEEIVKDNNNISNITNPNDIVKGSDSIEKTNSLKVKKKIKTGEEKKKRASTKFEKGNHYHYYRCLIKSISFVFLREYATTNRNR
jgi:hypothetical protein